MKVPSIYLTPRETEVVKWMADGKTADEIGTILGISGHTVKTLIIHARARLDVVNCTHLVAFSFRQGWLE